MRNHAPLILLLVSIVAVLAGCGEKAKNAASKPAEATALHVRAAGMVKKLGIT